MNQKSEIYKSTSIKLNIIYQMLYEILALSLPLFTSPYVSRVLGPEQLGIYSYTYSIATYFGLIAMLGVKNNGNREIAKCSNDREKISKKFSSIYFIQLCMSVITGLVYIVFLVVNTSAYSTVFLIQILYIVSYYIDITWFFYGLENFKLTSLCNATVKLLTFVGIFAFVRTKNDLNCYCLIIACSTLISQIIPWFVFHKYADIVRPDIDVVKANIRPMLVLFIPVLATTIYNVMDKIMVGALNTKVQLGYYENAEKIINCVKTVITSFGIVMMPRMSKLVAENNKEDSRRYMNDSTEIIMLLAFGMAFGIAAIAFEFAPVFWGDEFSACGILLIGLSVTLPFSAFGNIIRTQYLIPNGMDTTYVVAVTIGALMNLICNLMFIPRMGAQGAVFGTIVAEAMLCIAQVVAVGKKLPISQYIKNMFPYFIFGGIMLASIRMLKLSVNPIINLVVQIVIGLIIYVLLSLLYLKRRKPEMLRVVTKWGGYSERVSDSGCLAALIHITATFTKVELGVV